MKKKILAVVLSGGVLLLGMLFLAAISAPKFGSMEGGRTGWALRENLRELQVAEVAHEAAFDEWVLAPPCPAGTPEPSFCPVGGGDSFDNGLGWRPDGSRLPHGRYTVERTETGFLAAAEHDGQRYIVRETGEPQRDW